MSKKDKNRPFASREFHDAACGKVKISFNKENEIKTALVTQGAARGREDQLAAALWKTYVREKTAEWNKSFDQHVIRRTNGARLNTPLHMETKPYRRRTFQTVASRHPADIEIRMEDLTTMIKVAQMAPGARVLSRMEIRIAQQFVGDLEFSDIPGHLGKYVSRSFRDSERRFPGVLTESWRDKITVPMAFEWAGEALVVEYERAKDIGASLSLAGHKRDITEFEGEVKRIYRFDDYMRGHKVDLKDAPGYADWTPQELDAMAEAFLTERLDRFLDFANNWLDMRKQKDARVETVTHSKSQPEMDALHAVLTEGGATARRALEHVLKSREFKVDPTLAALRLEMGHP